MYSAFDDVLMDWDAYKVEILGDAYFVVCGCPEERSPIENAARATEVALILQSLMPSLTDDTGMMMRVGLHSGHVVAGLLALKIQDFIYLAIQFYLQTKWRVTVCLAKYTLAMQLSVA